MGRTNPTFRDFLDGYEDEWSPYRRGLRRRYKPHFDRLFERARGHADAAGYMNAADPEIAFLVSVLLAQEVELRELREEVRDLRGNPCDELRDEPRGKSRDESRERPHEE